MSSMLAVESEMSTPRKRAHIKQEIDEIEDLILEDFSFSDNHYSEEGSDQGGDDIVSRCSSVDSMASFSIRRQKGKQLLKDHTDGCLKILSNKIDLLVRQFEDRVNFGQGSR